MEQLKVRKSLLTQWYFTLHVSFTCMLPQHLEINYIFIQDTTSHFFLSESTSFLSNTFFLSFWKAYDH